jgi:hypothetical protein
LTPFRSGDYYNRAVQGASEFPAEAGTLGETVTEKIRLTQFSKSGG